MDIWGEASQVPPLGRRIALALAYSAFILVNVASSLGWLGATNAEVSAKFQTALTPAGWAFSIWGLVFLLEGLGTAHQLQLGGYDPDGWKQRYVNAVMPGWAASWVCAAAWQLAFVRQTPAGMWLALALISASLGGMCTALVGLYRLKAQYGPAPGLLLYGAYFLPTSINAAWLSVAAAVQLLVALLGGGAAAAPGGLELPALAAAAAVTLAGVAVAVRQRDTAYGLTLVWALVAVYEATPSPQLRAASLVGVIALLAACLASVLRHRPVEVLQDDPEERQPLRAGPGEP